MFQLHGWDRKVFIFLVLTIIIFGAVGSPNQAVLAKANFSPVSYKVGTGFRTELSEMTYTPNCVTPPNEIVAENCLPGNPPSEWDISGAGDANIQGYATDISVNQDETVFFKIDTDASAYRLNIYRLGYYNGDGARFITTVYPSASLPQTQPACLFDDTNDVNLVDCGNWGISASWAVPSSAVSGIYIAKLVREDGTSGSSHIVFIVRDDDGNSDLLFQTSDTTWEAYNRYGGYSLYDGPGHAHKVSYNRPFTTRDAPTEDWLFNAEYPMIRWLERNGYDVSYFTDVDSDRHGSEILEHKVFLSVGHDEYWSAEQRAAVEDARDTGVNLAFFSGNESYWKTRWEPSTADGGSTDYRVLVSYKEGDAQGSEHYNCLGNFDCDPNPTVWTGLWRQNQTGHDGGQPENSMSGQISWGDATSAIQVPAWASALRFWRNTGISTDTTTTLAADTLGYEFDWEQDTYSSSYPAGRFTLSDTTANGKNHRMSIYRAPSGALIFGAGTVQWSWGLDGNHDRGSSTEDARMQQATVNILADMSVQPGSLQSGLVAATASTDTSVPTATITSPTGGTDVPSSSTVVISGTATDAGGVVAAVEVSVDNGVTWHTATGRTTWTYNWTPGAAGSSTTIRSRAVDDSGNIGAMSSAVNVNITERICPCSIWDVQTPSGYGNDGQPIELGVKIQSAQAGYILGVRFYKDSSNTGAHIGHLWNTGGTQLAEKAFSGESASGWQEVYFDAPIPVLANTTYIASYFSPNGGYSYSDGYFASAYTSSPLNALADTAGDSNGVYNFGSSGFPASSYQKSNYWVDIIFNTTATDTTPPSVTQVSPTNNASNVSIGALPTVIFSEGMDPLTITSGTFELRDSSNTLVPASVSYDSSARKATLTPTSALNPSSTYTAHVISGPSGVTDLAGTPLASDHTWTFTTKGIPPDEGPGGPILVLSTAANPFSRYYAEILRAEGLNSFTATDVSNLTAPLLDEFQVVILGEMTLKPPQVTLLSDWVNNGGNLIAMRPDSQLTGLLGLTSTGSTMNDAYLRVNTASSPGQGIINQTIQYHSTADLYGLNGATAVATLYSNSTTATSSPAVTIMNVGSNGGQAATFTYDLARSIVYTRQGNPAWSGDERDGTAPIRSDDQFFGAKAGDVQPNWVDLSKIAIPQADEQQRLLANLILFMNADNNPLPRFWYFPRFEKAVVVMTSDNHASANATGRLDQYIADSPVGCSVDDWECVRASMYIYPGTTMSETQANTYTAKGFEIGVHVNTGCANYTLPQLENYFTSQLNDFATRFPSLPHQDSERTHCIAWSNWSYQPTVKQELGIRLDTNYYFWPPDWVNDQPGFFTGSGIPMRFADLDGSMFDVYQAATQMTDESGQSYPYTIDTLLSRALGTQGYYGVFTANMHSDNLDSQGSDAIIASAQSNGVPVISGRQLLKWLDGRNTSAFSGIIWDGNHLDFYVSVGAGANGLDAILPVQSNAGTLAEVTREGSPVSFTTETIKGIEYAVFSATPGGNYRASYDSDTNGPIISNVAATNNPDGTVTITWNTDENADSRVDYGTTSGAPTLNKSDTAYTSSHTLTLTGLTSGVTYYFTITSKDASNNGSISAETPFTPSGDICPCSIWDDSATPAISPVNDGQAIEVGTKFRSETAGYITAIRFYKGSGDTDTHVGHLWTSTGTQLAEVTFTNETASGWQEMTLPTPVLIDANITYITSVYSSSNGYFSITSSGLSSAVNNPPLRALASGEDGPNGVYAYGGGFPSNGSNSNYWIDVVFENIPNPDTEPPTIIDRSPAPNATDVSRVSKVTVKFSEDMDPATITNTTIKLRASGSGSDVPSTVSYANGVATLNPDANLQANSVYQITVSGTVTDEAGNPLGSDDSWSFTTNNLAVLTDSSATDFNSGTVNGCYLNNDIGDGALQLSSGFAEDFSGETLPAAWTSYQWTGSAPVISGGSVTMDGSEAFTTAEFGPGRSLEFAATFGAQSYQHIGFGGTLIPNGSDYVPYNGSPWIMFSTGNDAAQLYARVLPAGSSAYNSGNDKIPLGNYLGSEHTYRIDWKANSIDFYVDGTLKTTVNTTISTPMRVAISDYQSGGPTLFADWVKVSPPYATPCTYTSRVFDAGEIADWQGLSWTGTTPTGTSIGFETRTGNTSSPDPSWSVWEAVNSPIASPNGQYAQYRATLNSTNTNQTPTLEDVTFTYALNTAPTLNGIGNKFVNESSQSTFSVTASDDGLPASTLTYSLSGEPAGASITTGGNFTWTPTEAQGPNDYTFDVCVSDGALSDCETITVTVSEVNAAPMLNAIGNKTVNEGTQLAFTATASDTDLPANTLTFLLSGEPTGASITTGGNFTWTPTEAQGPNDYTFDVCVSDGALSDCETITVTVNEANIAPVLNAIGNKVVDEGTQLAFTATASDTDIPSNTLTYSLSGEPAGASIATGGNFTWTPTEAQGPNDYPFDVCVSDGALSDCETITVRVSEVNQTPVITETDPVYVTMSEDSNPVAFNLIVHATDAEDNTLTWSVLVPASHGLAYASGTGSSKVINYTPTLNYNGADSFVIQVSDGFATDTITVNVTINAVDNPPTDIELSNNSINENLSAGILIGTLSTTDFDIGDSFNYSFCGGADDSFFQINGNQLSSAASFDFETKASYTICIRSTDSTSLSTTKSFNIIINDLADTSSFTDVPTSYWAWIYIEAIYKAGITSGCSPTPRNYCPTSPVTRAQMAVFLEKGLHGNAFTPSNVSPTFNDTSGHWAEDWIEALKSDAITSGCGNGNYCPEDSVTRAQMAVFLLKAMHGSNYSPPAASPTFGDDAGHWAQNWIEELALEGITSGCGNGNYCPDSPVTRDQMAVFLVKAFGLP